MALTIAALRAATQGDTPGGGGILSYCLGASRARVGSGWGGSTPPESAPVAPSKFTALPSARPSA